ncbi:hypothetical protein M9H77_30783 [Catharanthus roseus]|uniref:Uncharacterized protein n=1 Tax=Catharanthus roseus TaxID=4058 RepID=A0ACC0A252_CATRO|nr:hypothetical protein M9H77_30783 [Catharanthus roseus]
MIAYKEDALKIKIEEFDAKSLQETTLPSPVGFCWHHSGGKNPTINCRFYPNVAGFPLECEASKSSIEVLQDEVILGRIWIQFNSHKRIHIKVNLEGSSRDLSDYNRKEGEPILIKAKRV